MKILVSRSQPQKRLEEYNVTIENDETTVMDVLDYIYQHLDHTLSYYRHSVCSQGVCGRCGVKLNGKNVLACSAVIDRSLDKITVEPVNGEVVRDLVVSNI